MAGNGLEKTSLPSHTPQQTAPEELYQERAEHFKADFDRETALWNRVANWRLLAFLLAAASLGWGIWQRSIPFIAIGIVLTAAFGVLVRYHRVVSRRRRGHEQLWKINTEALARLARDWDALPLRHNVQAHPGEPYTVDLDVFGHASLFHLLDTVTTHSGERILASWLRAPASPEVVARRQEAVAELSPMVDLRDDLELRGRLVGDQRPDPDRFLAWAESEPWLARRPWLRWGAIASTALLWLLVLAQVVGLIPYPLWLLVAGLNLMLWLSVARAMIGLLESATSGEAGFRHYAAALEPISAAPFRASELKRLQATLAVEHTSAAGYARRLYRLSTFVIPTSSMLYIPIQAFTLWDVHLLAAFERWQHAVGKHARSWIDTLGEMEALSALARLAHDNPAWTLPLIDPAADTFAACDLGHPLLPPKVRVDNDVEAGPPGTFLLVTGSNMSGKSTLLRAIGVNIVLAEAGGPVCATSLELPPVDLWTSMRVEDSLERGVSYYMAELQRLKSVVDAAKLDRSGGERRLFYLLDEILQGTNTAERQIAARRVILHLVRQGALGAVSTHDLTLAASPDIAAAARLVHFTESLSSGTGGPAMTFDYKLRPGIATSTNALRLMEIVGLDLGEEEAEPVPR